MKRAIIVTAGTVVGVGAALAYTPRPPAMAMPTAAAVVPTGTTQPTATVPLSASTTPTATTAAPAVAAAAPAAPASPSGVFTGEVVSTRFGDIQVQMSVVDGTITDAVAVTYPAVDAKSAAISASSIPTLRSETLAAQSADIATVSGASYTTTGWTTSLQSALTQAGL